MREAHAEHRVAGLQQRQIDRRIGLRSGMRLHIGIGGAKQLLCALDRQCLGNIHVLATAVVALARITLGILVGQHRTLRLEHARAGIVLRSNQLDMVFLPATLAVDGPGKLGVKPGNRAIPPEHSGWPPLEKRVILPEASAPAAIGGRNRAAQAGRPAATNASTTAVHASARLPRL